jgi:hypothetical protein
MKGTKLMVAVDICLLPRMRSSCMGGYVTYIKTVCLVYIAIWCSGPCTTPDFVSTIHLPPLACERVADAPNQTMGDG